jgi:hypothetical protein
MPTESKREAEAVQALWFHGVQLDVHFAVCNHITTPLIRGQLCTLLSCSARGDQRSAYH